LDKNDKNYITKFIKKKIAHSKYKIVYHYINNTKITVPNALFGLGKTFRVLETQNLILHDIIGEKQ